MFCISVGIITEERLLTRVTFGSGVVSRPLLLLLPALADDGTGPSSLEGELADSSDLRSSSGCAKTVATTKIHQNLISSLLPLFH